MSTTTNLHELAEITATVFQVTDDHPAFVSVKFIDDRGNQVTLFPKDLNQFVADVLAAVTNARSAS